MTIPSQDLYKTCTKCGIRKHADEYYIRTSNGTKHGQCKVCFRSRVYATRKNKLASDPEWRSREAEYCRRRRGWVREAVFQAYGGWKCACCGETEPLFLTLDHVANNGAEDRRRIGGKQTAAGYRTYAYLYARDFPPGYQILCANCQHGKRMNHGVCPHQVRCNDYPAKE
jgi:hypothetical protein